MQLARDEGRRRLAPRRPEDLDHLRALRRLVLGRRAHRPGHEAQGHHAVPDPDGPPGPHDPPDLDDRRRAHQRGVLRRRVRRRTSSWSGELNQRLDLHLRGARPRALRDDAGRAARDEGRGARASGCAARRATASPLRATRAARARIAQLATQLEVARMLQRRVISEAVKGGVPTVRVVAVQALHERVLGKRVANAALDLIGPEAQLKPGDDGAPARRPLRALVPLHRRRHDRRRHLRDPEEHHRAPRARAAGELLSARRRDAAPAPRTQPPAPAAPRAGAARASRGGADAWFRSAGEPPPTTRSGEVLLTHAKGSPNLAQVVARGVRWVHAYGTGVDGFPFHALGGRVAHLLARRERDPDRRVGARGDARRREEAARGVDPRAAGALEHRGPRRPLRRTLGLVGLGGIGGRWRARALAFGMRVRALRRSAGPSPLAGVEIASDLGDAARAADHLVLAAPRTPRDAAPDRRRRARAGEAGRSIS